ncbi:MAG: ribosome-associated translation inhibitor RaiA [Acidimicrobiales bacterium]|nr:ribosome-associated translation inhibitor RaiA [Acidimicrobiales bacterium]
MGRELVARTKYRNARSAVGWLAWAMASTIDGGSIDVGAIDVVTWAPTTPERRRERGFDQAELLARAVARHLGRPCRRLLRRAPGPAQTGRSRAERHHEVVLRAVGRPSRRVLVVDDVATTGATLTAVAAALRRAGTVEVWAVTAARTPAHAGGLPSAADAVFQEGCVDIKVSGRHTEVSDALRQATIEKIGRLSRYVDGMERAEVHFSEERNPRIVDKEICEVTLEGHGHHVRCKVSAPDGFAAVDRAVEKLEHQLHKLKTKLGRRAASPGDDQIVTSLPDDAAASAPRIVKTKQFAMSTMDADEALLQMDLLGHDFYVFTNDRTGRAAVVYRREDGDVGLIDQAD